MKKLIKIKQDDIQELTFEEVYPKYRRLIYKKARQWNEYAGYDLEELLQVGTINLWRAYEYYDISYNVAFMTIAFPFVENGFKNYHTQHKSKTKLKTAQIKILDSLHSTVTNPKNNKKTDETELINLVEGSGDFSSKLIDQITLKKIFNQFSKRQRQDIISYINGYNKQEIADAKNIKKRSIERNFNRFRSLYIKEMIK